MLMQASFHTVEYYLVLRNMRPL